MGKFGGTFLVLALVYFGVALYGKHHNCGEAGGVTVVGLGWFECVREVKHD